MKLKLPIAVISLVASGVVAKNVVGKNKFKVQDEALQRRDQPSSNKYQDGINRVADRPTHDEQSGEQLFHIQDGQYQLTEKIDPLRPDVEHIFLRPEDVGDGPKKGAPLLRTELAINRDVSIFAGYVREFESLESRFNNKREFSVVLAPSDEAISSLGAKPWEFPNAIDPSLSEEQKEQATRRNILWFLMSHLHYGEIETVVGKFGGAGSDQSTFHLQTETGETLKVEPLDDKLRISNKDKTIVATVTSVKPVENGVIWVLDRSLVSPQ